MVPSASAAKKMGLLRNPWVLLLAVLASPARSQVTLETLEDRHQQSVSTPLGREYETEAGRAFWGDARFMRECAPPESPVAEPLTIYFVVGNDGRLGQLTIIPKSKVADCVRSHVAGRQFPKPPSEFVGKIYLRFSK
jgi:hypothetical protein